jgi:hypothetical protein
VPGRTHGNSPGERWSSFPGGVQGESLFPAAPPSAGNPATAGSPPSPAEGRGLPFDRVKTLPSVSLRDVEPFDFAQGREPVERQRRIVSEVEPWFLLFSCSAVKVVHALELL